MSATVTILANDDAAGFIYLESVDLVTLDEPASDGSGVTSTEITILRGPGMYGVVSVPYEIVPEIEGNREDLSPMQGTITFQNKQVGWVLSYFRHKFKVTHSLSCLDVIQSHVEVVNCS